MFKWLRRLFSPQPRLSVELVPSTCWASNVRTNISAEEWDRIRKSVAKKAGHRCEICQGIGPKWPVECHEIWHYNDKKLVQTLNGLIALCPSCHEVKHIGLATLKGRGKEAERHLAKVNGWSAPQAADYIKKQIAVWTERSEKQWSLDMSWLENQGIKVTVTDRKAGEE